MSIETLSAVSVSAPIAVSGVKAGIPAFAVTLTSDATLEYAVDVTLDDVASSDSSRGNWQPVKLAFGKSVSSESTMQMVPMFARGIRCRVTSWTAGSLNFQVAQ